MIILWNGRREQRLEPPPLQVIGSSARTQLWIYPVVHIWCILSNYGLANR